MNVVGERLSVVQSTDPSKIGMSGVVLLDTARTLLVKSGGRNLRVEKEGSVFIIDGSKRIVTGSDISGRLEDRWGARSR